MTIFAIFSAFTGSYVLTLLIKIKLGCERHTEFCVTDGQLCMVENIRYILLRLITFLTQLHVACQMFHCSILLQSSGLKWQHLCHLLSPNIFTGLCFSQSVQFVLTTCMLWHDFLALKSLHTSINTTVLLAVKNLKLGNSSSIQGALKNHDYMHASRKQMHFLPNVSGYAHW